MTSPISPTKTLDHEYLPVRAKILEIAASLDRIERATPQDANDQRWQQLQAGIRLLLKEESQRAEQVQLLFSRPYDDQWRDVLQVGR